MVGDARPSRSGKKILLTGATGMVGSQVLHLLLADPSVGTVVSVGRRKTGLQNPKLDEVVHSGFLDFSDLKAELTAIDACFYCLGVYQNQVSKQAFFEITCDYQKALTDVLEQASPEATFVLFGASGADPSEKSWATFSKAKGRAERLLHETTFPRKYIFRPGYIHPTDARRPAGWSHRLVVPIGGWLMTVFPGVGITDRALAQAMVTVGLQDDRPSTVFSNRMIRALEAKRDS